MIDMNPKKKDALKELLDVMLSRFEILVERGFVTQNFVAKFYDDNNEITKFLRHNRSIVGDILTIKMKKRPTKDELISQGIVPKNDWVYYEERQTNSKKYL
mmetsp:Transcript_53895/g.66052  ORF Transcript_53895/g.66052 Transcript_53895/m.66052 type:complete len:101 (+) Transcript_53895:132-434(+)